MGARRGRARKRRRAAVTLGRDLPRRRRGAILASMVPFPSRPFRARAAAIAVLLAGCAGSSGEASRARWHSPLNRDHVLAGKIWDVRSGAFVDAAALEQAATGADVLLLGEVHDNLDHHAMQARLVRAVTAAGRTPVLAFEMLDTSQQEAVDAALAKSPRDPDAVAKAVGWDRSGWGPFTRYRAIVAAGLEAGLPIVAANVPRRVVAGGFEGGMERLPEPVRARIERQGPLTDQVLRGLRHEMQESHCGALPDEALDPMILSQRVRDAAMAERLDAAGDRGAILITGTGHVRTDRGVPTYLDPRPRRVLSVAMVEVRPGKNAPGDYAEDFNAQALPADVVVFTPGADREDPCKEFLKRHERPAKPRPAPDVRAAR